MKNCKECHKQYSQMNKNAEGGCTPPVLQINNPSEFTLFHKVVVPTSMGDDTAFPPEVGLYKNVLLYYEANQKTYLYSSDGIPTLLVNGVTDYEQAINLPQINGNTLIGDKTGMQLGLQDKLTAGDNISIDENNVISAQDTTYGPATDETIGLVKPGDGLEVGSDGTLDVSNIEDYILGFDTVADMVASETLVAGSKCQTLGKETINDGYGAIYTIGNSGEIELDNGLFATMVGNTQGDNYIDEIVVTTGRANDTDYTLATIPLNDADGSLIGLSVNEDSTVTPLGYAGKNFTTITSNAGLTRQNTSSQWKQGAVISNGVALHGDLCDVAPASYLSYIGFKADRSVLDFPATTSTDTMLAQGVTNAYLTFGKIVTNGAVSIDPNVDADQINPMCCVGVKNDGTLGIIASEGRTERNGGMTIAQMASLMLSLGFTNVWRCDGGGSTSLVYKGSKQNRNIDDYATTDRDIHVTLNFKKPTINKQLAEVYSFIGKERQLLNRNIVYDVHDRYELKRSWGNYFNVTTGYNKMATADTWTQLHLSDSLAHRRKEAWNLLKDSNNRTIGLEFVKAGVYEIDMQAIIMCANVAGNRGLRISDENNSGITSHASSASYFAPSAAGDGFEKNLITSFNASIGTKIYFSGRGQVNDDFNRMNIVVKEIGTADAG